MGRRLTWVIDLSSAEMRLIEEKMGNLIHPTWCAISNETLLESDEIYEHKVKLVKIMALLFID